MPINKETIISVFDEKLTLMQWLKTINKALEDAVLTGVEITKKGNATLSFKFTFEDGTFLETNDIVLQQGESVNGAYIQNGHLYLTLTNGNNLDAGNVKPVSNFSIDANQHLIVHYADGTSQDLGAIFSGNVNIDGNFTANSIVENMTGYSFTKGSHPNFNYEFIYAGIVKNGNKLTCVVALNLTMNVVTTNNIVIGYFNMPSSVASKLYPTQIGQYNFLDVKEVPAYNDFNQNIMLKSYNQKAGNSSRLEVIVNNMEVGTKYYIRYEVTFLLSDNLAQ